MKKFLDRVRKKKNEETTDSKRNSLTYSHYSLSDSSELNSIAGKQSLTSLNGSLYFESAGSTPLHEACWAGNFSKVKKHSKKYDVNTLDKSNRTPLHHACAQGYKEIVWFLLGIKAKTNLCDNDGYTPLLQAVQHCQFAVVQMLIEHGVDTSPVNKDGNTALHLATLIKSVDLVKLLVKRSISLVNLENKDGSTALHIAAELDSIPIAQVLIQHSADLNRQDKQGRTSLAVACKHDNDRLVELLIQEGADSRIQDVHGWSAEDAALIEGNTHCAEIIRSSIAHQVTANSGNNGTNVASKVDARGDKNESSNPFEQDFEKRNGIDLTPKSSESTMATLESTSEQEPEIGELTIRRINFKPPNPIKNSDSGRGSSNPPLSNQELMLELGLSDVSDFESDGEEEEELLFTKESDVTIRAMTSDSAISTAAQVSKMPDFSEGQLAVNVAASEETDVSSTFCETGIFRAEPVLVHSDSDQQEGEENVGAFEEIWEGNPTLLDEKEDLEDPEARRRRVRSLRRVFEIVATEMESFPRRQSFEFGSNRDQMTSSNRRLSLQPIQSGAASLAASVSLPPVPPLSLHSETSSEDSSPSREEASNGELLLASIGEEQSESIDDTEETLATSRLREAMSKIDDLQAHEMKDVVVQTDLLDTVYLLQAMLERERGKVGQLRIRLDGLVKQKKLMREINKSNLTPKNEKSGTGDVTDAETNNENGTGDVIDDVTVALTNDNVLMEIIQQLQGEKKDLEGKIRDVSMEDKAKPEMRDGAVSCRLDSIFVEGPRIKASVKELRTMLNTMKEAQLHSKSEMQRVWTITVQHLESSWRLERSRLEDLHESQLSCRVRDTERKLERCIQQAREEFSVREQSLLDKLREKQRKVSQIEEKEFSNASTDTSFLREQEEQKTAIRESELIRELEVSRSTQRFLQDRVLELEKELLQNQEVDSKRRVELQNELEYSISMKRSLESRVQSLENELVERRNYESEQISEFRALHDKAANLGQLVQKLAEERTLLEQRNVELTSHVPPQTTDAGTETEHCLMEQRNVELNDRILPQTADVGTETDHNLRNFLEFRNAELAGRVPTSDIGTETEYFVENVPPPIQSGTGFTGVPLDTETLLSQIRNNFRRESSKLEVPGTSEPSGPGFEFSRIPVETNLNQEGPAPSFDNELSEILRERFLRRISKMASSENLQPNDVKTKRYLKAMSRKLRHLRESHLHLARQVDVVAHWEPQPDPIFDSRKSDMMSSGSSSIVQQAALSSSQLQIQMDKLQAAIHSGRSLLSRSRGGSSSAKTRVRRPWKHEIERPWNSHTHLRLTSSIPA